MDSTFLESYRLHGGRPGKLKNLRFLTKVWGDSECCVGKPVCSVNIFLLHTAFRGFILSSATHIKIKYSMKISFFVLHQKGAV